MNIHVSPQQIYNPISGNSQLHRYLKKHFVGNATQLERIMGELPESKKIFGSLPFEWLEGIDKSLIPSVTKMVGLVFSAFTQIATKSIGARYASEGRIPHLLEAYSDNNGVCEKFFKLLRIEIDKIEDNATKQRVLKIVNEMGVTYKPSIEYFKELLSKILNKDFEMSPYKRGNFGRTYLLDLKGKKYILKTFFEDKFSSYSIRHGKCGEVAHAPFVRNHTAKDRFAKFYMGKLSFDNPNDTGFMLSKFIKNKKQHHNIHQHDMAFDHIYSRDLIPMGNMIDTIIVDYGDVCINPKLMSRQKVKMARRLKEALVQKNIKMFDNICKKYENSAEFKEVLEIIRVKLNEHILSTKDIKLDEKSLAIYYKLGVRLNPADRYAFLKEDAQRIMAAKLFDENQTRISLKRANDYFMS